MYIYMNIHAYKSFLSWRLKEDLLRHKHDNDSNMHTFMDPNHQFMYKMISLSLQHLFSVVIFFFPLFSAIKKQVWDTLFIRIITFIVQKWRIISCEGDLKITVTLWKTWINGGKKVACVNLRFPLLCRFHQVYLFCLFKLKMQKGQVQVHEINNFHVRQIT